MCKSSTASLMRLAKTATATTQARRADVYEEAGHGQSRARAVASGTRCAPLTQAEEGQGVVVAVMAPPAAPPQLLLRLVLFHKIAVCQLVQRAVHPHLGHQVKVLVVVLCGATAQGVRRRQRPPASPRAARPKSGRTGAPSSSEDRWLARSRARSMFREMPPPIADTWIAPGTPPALSRPLLHGHAR